MTSTVAQAARIVAELRERLKAEFGLEDGDDALEDTLEGETDINEQLASLAREAVRSEAMAEGMKALIRDNQDRKSRLEHRGERIRAQISWAMQEAGLKKLPSPDMTISLSEGKPPLIIANEDVIPDDFCRFKRELNKVKIREALVAGTPLGFAYLGNPSPSLTIRTR